MELLKLMKYEIIDKKFSLYILAIIVGLLSILSNSLQNITRNLFFQMNVINGFISIITLISINTKRYPDVFNSKPGYMIFLTNISKSKILISRVILEIIEFITFYLIITDLSTEEDLYYYYYGINLEFPKVLLAFLVYINVLAIHKLWITIKELIFLKSEMVESIMISCIAIWAYYLLYSLGKSNLNYALISNFFLSVFFIWLLLEKKIDIN